MKDPNPDYPCIQCKHSFTGLSARVFWFGHPPAIFYKCRKAYVPAYVESTAVHGNVRVAEKYKSCSTARIQEEFCGPEAKQWTPKHKKDLFKMLTKEAHD